VGAVVAGDVRGEPVGTARHHVHVMENVERLSGLVLIDAYGFRREREIFGQKGLAHLRDGGRGFLADRRVDRRERFRCLGYRRRDEPRENAKRSYLKGIP
jgi:hypothetical protein